MNRKSVIKFLAIAIISFMSLSCFAGSINNMIPYMLLNSESHMGSSSSADYSLSSQISAAQFYTLESNINSSQNGFSGNDLVLAQSTTLLNSITSNN